MITSAQNNKVKQWNKLKKKKDRQQLQQFLIEGFHLVQEAVKSEWNLKEVIVEDGVEVPDWLPNCPLTTVSSHVFKAISDTQTPQGIAGVVEIKQQALQSYNKLLLVDAVQDPGNLGTIIRTADAADFDGVVLGEGTVDMYNEKVIRATQGSLFHLPILQENLSETIHFLKQKDVSVWASTLEGAEDYHTLTVPDRVALVVGNEGAGIQPDVLEVSDHKVTIPIFGKAESLNVSIATGILIYHLAITPNQ
ncbi:TrmH family RNA methyltransferase [Aquibacillus albus]|uniref:TrmH family RNA methyltransferase n=1 Tax=Aquibacillus albus TaxID=1168171 RepID=A0ABS2N1E7_9BACI|nr:RNA methyltransferase [Aquibacillus albus]MBM7571971.1 TrmH family RNA methyltransferase [Aquibacillus albus]